MRLVGATLILFALAGAALAERSYDRKLEEAVKEIVAGKIGDIRPGFEPTAAGRVLKPAATKAPVHLVDLSRLQLRTGSADSIIVLPPQPASATNGGSVVVLASASLRAGVSPETTASVASDAPAFLALAETLPEAPEPAPRKAPVAIVPELARPEKPKPELEASGRKVELPPVPKLRQMRKPIDPRKSPSFQFVGGKQVETPSFVMLQASDAPIALYF